jgi:hypothetical protein
MVDGCWSLWKDGNSAVGSEGEEVMKLDDTLISKLLL